MRELLINKNKEAEILKVNIDSLVYNNKNAILELCKYGKGDIYGVIHVTNGLGIFNSFTVYITNEFSELDDGNVKVSAISFNSGNDTIEFYVEGSGGEPLLMAFTPAFTTIHISNTSHNTITFDGETLKISFMNIDTSFVIHCSKGCEYALTKWRLNSYYGSGINGKFYVKSPDVKHNAVVTISKNFEGMMYISNGTNEIPYAMFGIITNIKYDSIIVDTIVIDGKEKRLEFLNTNSSGDKICGYYPFYSSTKVSEKYKNKIVRINHYNGKIHINDENNTIDILDDDGYCIASLNNYLNSNCTKMHKFKENYFGIL